MRPVCVTSAGVAVVLLQHQQQLADGEHTDDDHHELDAVGEVDVAAGEAVDARVGIETRRRTSTGR